MSQTQSGEIWSKWEEYWNTEAKKYEMTESCTLFYNMFKKSFDYSEKSKTKNKKLNFKIKNMYIVFLAIVIVAQFLTLWKWIWPGLKDISLDRVCAIELPIILVILLVTLTVTKVLDINKYQETFARHELFQNLRETEMILFVLGIGEYEDNGEKRSNGAHLKHFMEQIIGIEKKNIEKFCDNMENKEKSLREGIDNLAIKLK